MRNQAFGILGAVGLLLLMNTQASRASYIQVDILHTTSTASVLPDLNLGRINLPPEFALMPFYFRVFFPPTNNSNWGIELYSDNQQVISSQPSNGIYRGLRGTLDVNQTVPLYWQDYAYDLNIGASYNSLTVVAETLGLADDITRRDQWGVIYDRSDENRSWDTERPLRTVVSTDGLGNYPSAGRTENSPPVYIYFGGDLTSNINEDYVGQIVLDFFLYPFDFSTGCFVTPNPVKPVLGQRAYFNFHTNSPDSQVKIKIYDPTGFPVVTLHNTRYWNGRNANHQYVEGGLYLYQIEVEGHVIGGTVVVIK